MFLCDEQIFKNICHLYGYVQGTSLLKLNVVNLEYYYSHVCVCVYIPCFFVYYMLQPIFVLIMFM